MYLAREERVRDDCRLVPAEIFSIPHDGKFIVFAPLKQIAFVANQATINLIARKQKGQCLDRKNDAVRFIDRLGILETDIIPKEDNLALVYEPIITVLMMGTSCNLRCTYCYARSGEGPKEFMPWEIARQSIDVVAANAAKRGLKAFELSFHGGGEPTMNWGVLKKAIEYAKSLPIPVVTSIATNGVLNSAQRRFVVDNFDGLSLSFDGLPAVQNKQRPRADGGDSFPMVDKTIKALDEKGTPYGIRMTATPETVGHLGAMVEYVCRNTKAGHIQVEPVFPEGRGKNKLWPQEALSVFVDEYKKAIQIAQNYSRDFFYSGASPEQITNRFCTAAVEAMVLLANGEISSCFEVFSRQHPLSERFLFGRLNSGLVEIDEAKWQSITCRTGETIGHCADCFCRYSCSGDCMSKTFCQDDLDGFKPSWRCQINQELSKQVLLNRIAQNNGLWLGQNEEGGKSHG